jgi:hypothetical protein
MLIQACKHAEPYNKKREIEKERDALIVHSVFLFAIIIV